MLRTYFANLLRLSSLIIVLTLIVLSIILWYFGASLTIAGASPFAPAWVRIYTIIGVFTAYFGITFLRHFLARRANSRLINSMLANDELVSMGGGMAADEVGLIRERFEKALTTLRDNPIDGKKKRNFLYDLPWYVVIGPPGTGKTTILRNSGLNFPLAEDGQVAIQGIGGTRNCDWWISNDAVLIDTAGRYTTQDVNQGIDAAAWGGFLDLLKQQRRRRPVNGVILAISIADVVLSTEAERQNQAEILRQRLRELHRSFGMRLPVYVMFTKCDLIAGFEQYFDNITDIQREQIWGVTFPYDAEQLTVGPAFEKGFLDLVARLEQRLPLQLAAERNNGRRCRIYSFPHEFGSMSGVLRGFLTDVFRVNRYESQPLLRGVYFTSGTQEGTPFDRLLGAMGRSFSLGQSQQMAVSGKGKAYFIKHLLSDLIFPEQDLVGRNSNIERRLAAIRLGTYAAIALVTVGLSAYWLAGLSSSLSEIDEAQKTTELLEARLFEADQNRSLVNILPALNAAKTLRDENALPPGWRFTRFMAVDSGPVLSDATQTAYDNVLDTYLLPSMSSRLQSQLQLLSTSGDKNNLLLREKLETYLMLTTGENYAPVQVAEEFERQNEATFVLSPSDRKDMSEHSQRLLQLLPKYARIDQQTVNDARVRLSQAPQASDVYQRMVADSVRRYQVAPISVANVLGTGVLRADTATLGGRSSVLGIYTKNGFYNYFLPRLPEYIRTSTGTDWVLGSDSIGNEAYQELAEQIVTLYVKDYISAWREAVNQVRVIEFETLSRGQLVLQELSGPQSPLTALLTLLRDNTQLPLPGATSSNPNDPAAALAANAIAPKGIIQAVAGDTAESLQRTAITTALGNAEWPGKTIGDAFEPLNALVDPGNSFGSLDKVQQLFGDMFGTVAGITSAPQPEAAAFDYVSKRAKNPENDAFTRLRSEAITKPNPVSSMVSYVTDRNWQLLAGLSYDYLNERWQQEILPVCNGVLADRYPFSPQAEDEVTLDDFAELFRPSGTIDAFFNDNIAPFVSMKGRQITELEIQGGSIGFSRDSLAQLARAQIIRDAFFGKTGTAPEAKFTIEPGFLDPNALRATFTLDDAELTYRHGPIRGLDFIWPSKLDSSTASLAITLLDGSSRTTDQAGTWAIFRMLNKAGLSKQSGRDKFQFGITLEDVSATFRLKADSVTNPFDLSLYRSFSCPPAL